ncbi:MAG: PD-(D/E)XK nuclease family protein [Actinomyces sp.]|nr:MAG: PD-(D/E)XK nuclease family protein [Actinomyces sp.]
MDDEAPTPEPPPALSPSGASTFEQCPRRWRFRYVDRLPDPPGPDALAGTFAHRVLELLCGEAAADRTVERARVLARMVWPELAESDDFAALDLDADGVRAFKWRAWSAIEGLWDVENPATVEVHATELRVDTVVGGVPFRGVIDRVDVEPDGLVVTDYKSGRAPSARFAPARLTQVLLYAAALEAESGTRPVRARLLYLGQRSVDTTVTRDTLDEASEGLRRTWDDIRRSCEVDEFPARPGPLCGWCAYVDRCPEGSAAVAERQARREAEEAALLALAESA